MAMDTDAKPVERGEPKNEPMEIKEHGAQEDEVVREIDVYTSPSIDPNSRNREGSSFYRLDGLAFLSSF